MAGQASAPLTLCHTPSEEEGGYYEEEDSGAPWPQEPPTLTHTLPRPHSEDEGGYYEEEDSGAPLPQEPAAALLLLATHSCLRVYR